MTHPVNEGPFALMDDKTRSEWVDLISNCAGGESSAHNQIEGLEQSHIDEFMLNHEHDRCPRCDWWMENHTFAEVEDGEMVCEDCLTDEERDRREEG